MWLLGFSTNRKNLWIMGAIMLVILTTMILRWLTIYLEEHANKVGRDGKQDEEKASNKICNMCCPGVMRTYALEELKMATKDFRFPIGMGATSFVYLAELGDGRFGAVKRVMEERGGNKKIFLDEVSVLLRISHPNLVGLLGFCMEKGEQLLLLEYVPNKSLFDRMHRHEGQASGTLSWSNRMNIALDIARALDYLHSEADPPIIHRDVKSSNILLVDDDHAKLADFGLCKLGHDKLLNPGSIKGSFGYIDTTYLRTGIVSPKSDIYSFGVVLVELITGLKSMQGSATLAEWTQDCRMSDDIEASAKLLDPKLNGAANLEQLRVLIHVANAALLENSEARPDMSQIADMILSCMDLQPHHALPV